MAIDLRAGGTLRLEGSILAYPSCKVLIHHFYEAVDPCELHHILPQCEALTFSRPLCQLLEYGLDVGRVPNRRK